MKTIIPTLIITLFTITAQAQLISKFSWESGNASQADYGPAPLSISTTAYVSADGANGTKGLNPGTGSHDINIVLAGSSFTIPSLDISVDFRRKESQASFFTLGNFDFGMAGGALYAKFALAKGSSDTTINATNLYSIPNDNAFHTYRFKYNSASGLAAVYVDGASVYTYQRTPGTALSWIGAGNATIGSLMDGTNSNVAVLDNLIIQNPGFSSLPLQLLSFSTRTEESYSVLDWTSTHEIDAKSFVVERSTDGIVFDALGSVLAANDYAGTNSYRFIDSLPSAGANYYRLKMVDQDGVFTYSSVKKLEAVAAAPVATISCYPNPVLDYINVKIAHTGTADTYRYTVATLDGKILQTGVKEAGSAAQFSLNVTAAPKGLIIVRLQNTESHISETFKIFKN